jgi:hypothetical protein
MEQGGSEKESTVGREVRREGEIYVEGKWGSKWERTEGQNVR